ncbi:orotidine-5'-phosphate decarboxylase [Comamonadaceae bacterium G21597-S1]|nr:orotidine-5'-phosphate decarboxylase [Comamonadaceae bacterium G21597-S1]
MSSRIIIALDVDTRQQALQLVRRLGPAAAHYKIGLQLLTLAGPDLVRELVGMGKQVFLDLKLHEIPNSVAAAVRAAAQLGAGMVSVHASAGSAVLRAAAEQAQAVGGIRVLALTVITSLRDDDLPEIGLAPSVREQVCRLARLASAQGCDGVIASAREARWLAQLLPAGNLIVTPGIQLDGQGGHDQSRLATPRDARDAGATHVVVGRAITQAPDPAQAFARACADFTRSP